MRQKKENQNQIHHNLFDVVHRIAVKTHGGHFTIFSFSNHFKGCYGTPTDYDMRDYLISLPDFPSIKELLFEMATRPNDFDYYLYEGDKFKI